MQILEEQHQLSFHLQQQRLIELIRQGKTEEALEHAQEYLAPPGEEDPAFLEELGACNLSACSLLQPHVKYSIYYMQSLCVSYDMSVETLLAVYFLFPVQTCVCDASDDRNLIFNTMFAERTVTLLAFEDANQSPLADLMDVTQRQKTASELNAAILSSQCQVRIFKYG